MPVSASIVFMMHKNASVLYRLVELYMIIYMYRYIYTFVKKRYMQHIIFFLCLSQTLADKKCISFLLLDEFYDTYVLSVLQGQLQSIRIINVNVLYLVTLCSILTHFQSASRARILHILLAACQSRPCQFCSALGAFGQPFVTVASVAANCK